MFIATLLPLPAGAAFCLRAMAKSGPSVPERQREPVQPLARAAARKNPYLPPHRRRSQVPHQFASPLHQFSAKSCRSWHIARSKLRRRGSCRARFLPVRHGENRLVLFVGSCRAGFLKPDILCVGNTRRTHHLKHRPQKKPIQQHRSRCRKYRRQYKTRKVCNGDHRVPPVVRQTRWHAHHQIQLIDLIGFIGVQSRGSRGIWSTLCFLRRTLPPTSRVAKKLFLAARASRDFAIVPKHDAVFLPRSTPNLPPLSPALPPNLPWNALCALLRFLPAVKIKWDVQNRSRERSLDHACSRLIYPTTNNFRVQPIPRVTFSSSPFAFSPASPSSSIWQSPASSLSPRFRN